MLRSIRARLLLVSLVSLGPVAIAGVFTQRALSSQLEASLSVSTAHEILKLLGKVDTALGRTRGAVAAYALFDDHSAVLTVTGASTAAQRDLGALRRLVQDDPTQLERIKALERGLGEWEHDQGRMLMDLVQRGERQAAVRVAGSSWLVLQGLAERLTLVTAAEYVKLEQRTAIYATAQRRTMVVLLLGGVAAILVAVLSAVVLGRRITRPLMNLTSSARAVAEGDMTRRVDIVTHDEIGVLGSAFNAMLRQVTERQEALSRARRQAEALLAIARVVGGTNSLQEALRLVCRELAHLTGADTVGAYVLDPHGAELRPVAGYHVPKDVLGPLVDLRVAMAEHDFHDELVVRGRPVWSDDVAADPRFGFPAFRQFPHQSSLMLPLVLDDGPRVPSDFSSTSAPGRVSGAFYLVWWKERRRFAEPELETLQTVGQQVGILLRNARLVEALENRAGRLRTLAGLNHLVSSSLEVETVLRGIACAAAELVGAPVASFWLADDARRVLELRAFSDETIGTDFVARRQRYDDGALGWVAIHRQPLSVPDVFAARGFQDQAWWRAHGFSSFLGVPVVLDDVLLAVLSLNGTAPVRLSADDWELVGMFVTQAGVAIRNARLYAESSLHAKRLETLTRLTKVITSSLDPEAILPVLADAAVSLFPGAACRVWIVEADRIRLRAEAGVKAVGGGNQLELPLGEGLIGRVCASTAPVVLDDVYQFPDLRNAEWLRGQGFRSIAALPLVMGRAVAGAFVVATREAHHFEADEVSLLQALAEQTAVVLEKARLFRDVQERQRLTDDLYALAVALERSMHLRDRLQAFVERAKAALQFDRFAVMLATPDGATLELLAGTDIEHGTVRKVRLSEIGGGYRRAWDTGETLVVGSDEALAALTPLSADIQRDPVFRTRRFVIVPLKFRGRPIGIVSADNKPSRRPITPESVARLELFCQELAHSVSNARLYTEAQRREREVTVLFEFTRRIAATLDLGEVLDIITQYATETLGCDGAAVYRWDPTLGALVFARSRHTGAAAAHVPQLQPGEGIAGRAFAERRPVWTNDRASDPNVTYRPDTEDALGNTARAFIGVPIVIRDEVYGVLLAHRLSPHEWGADEVRLLSRVSAPAAVAVENARLYAETQQNLAGAGLLNEAARTLHRTLDVRRRLPAALADLGRTVNAIGASVSVFNSAGYADQVIPWGAAAYAGAGCITPLFRHRDEPLLVADVDRLGETVPGASLSADVRSLAAFTVRGRSRSLGVLTLLFGTPRVLSPFERRLLAAYADQLAMALDNTALFEEAETQKTLLEHIFASTSDGILFLDQAGRIAALNRRGEELLGVSTSEVVGRPFITYLVDALGERLRWVTPEGRSLQEIVEDLEQEATGDLEVQEPTLATLRWHASPTLDTFGARVGVTVTLRDVTREREVDRMKTEFVSAVSHELRTPLTSIKGSLHLLLLDDSRPLEATQRELLAICLNNTERLIRLITDILDVSKIEAGRIELALSHRRVAEFIQIAVDGIRAFADSRDVRVVVEAVATLPEVRVDLDRMVQVMTNLLSNAIKFSSPGSEVRVRADHVGAAVEIRVIDHGRGIAPTDLPRLFRKFQQLDSRTIREVGGTGLGLAICHGLVSEHGGTIRVESLPGQGSTFIVALPAASIPSASIPRLAQGVGSDP